MKERLLEFLKKENKSSAQLAEEIGVQPSGISHILSGRNNPSLDFVMKMLEKYRFLSTDWLLFGKGTMYKESKNQTLFDDSYLISPKTESSAVKVDKQQQYLDFDTSVKSEKPGDYPQEPADINIKVKKIVWFYDNKSFEEYNPG